MIKVYKAVWVTEDDKKTSLLFGKVAFYGRTKNQTKKPLNYWIDTVTVPIQGMPPFIFAFENLDAAQRFVINEYIYGGHFVYKPHSRYEGAIKKGKAIEIWECKADPYSHSLNGYGFAVDAPVEGTIFCANLVLHKLVKTYNQEVKR